MMKDEFEKLVGQKVSSEEYKDIEKVYMWHPSISNTKGKEQVANYWKEGLIQDLLPRAVSISDNEEKRRTLAKDIQDLEKERDATLYRIREEYEEKIKAMGLELHNAMNEAYRLGGKVEE